MLLLFSPSASVLSQSAVPASARLIPGEARDRRPWIGGSSRGLSAARPLEEDCGRLRSSRLACTALSSIKQVVRLSHNFIVQLSLTGGHGARKNQQVSSGKCDEQHVVDVWEEHVGRTHRLGRVPATEKAEETCSCQRTVNCTRSLTCQLANGVQRGATSKEARNQRQKHKAKSSRKVVSKSNDAYKKRITPSLQSTGFHSAVPVGFYCHYTHPLSPSVLTEPWAEGEAGQRWWRLRVHPLLLPVPTHAEYTEGWVQINGFNFHFQCW